MLDKIKKIKNENIIIFFEFITIFLLLFFVHNLIGLYYDDYGNASLSYGSIIDGVEGTNFNIGHIFKWIANTYMNWGGRVLYASTILIPLLKGGSTVYMLLQSIIITIILYLSYKIILNYNIKIKDKKIFIPIILFILYCLIDIAIHRGGTYWASASILYVWPMLPFLLSIYLYQKLKNKIKEKNTKKWKINFIILMLMIFIATFSQEQIGIAVIIFYVVYIFFDHLKEIKKYLKLDLFVLINSIISYAILFFAPGNMSRLATNSDFSNLSFFEKIEQNMPIILKILFSNEMFIFVLILSMVLIISLFNNIKKNKYLLIPIITQIIFVIIHFLNIYEVIEIPFYPHLMIFRIIYLINLLINLFIYSIYNKKMTIIAFGLSAAGSVFCLLMSPTIVYRSYIPLLLLLFIIIILIYIDCFNKNKLCNKILIIIFIPLVCFGMKNYYKIYSGYKMNYAMIKYNEIVLKNYGGQNTINLYKLYDDTYGISMPYNKIEGNLSSESWMKEYYNIPDGVKFIWNDFKEV